MGRVRAADARNGQAQNIRGANSSTRSNGYCTPLRDANTTWDPPLDPTNSQTLHVVFLGSDDGVRSYLRCMENVIPVDRLVLCCNSDGILDPALKRAIYHRLLLIYRVSEGRLQYENGSLAATVLDELSRRVGVTLRVNDHHIPSEIVGDP